MENLMSSFYVYCMNAKCKISIYNQLEELQLPFTIDNLVATHNCPCCNKAMVSAMDVEIKQIVAEANLPKVPKFSFHNN